MEISKLFLVNVTKIRRRKFFILFIVESSESLFITIVPKFDSSSTIVPLSGTNVPQSVCAIIVPSELSRSGTKVPVSGGNSLIVREFNCCSSSSCKEIFLQKLFIINWN